MLASSSVHRRALLDRLLLPYSVRVPGVDEQLLPGESPDNYVRRLAHAKAAAVADADERAVIIGSDQAAVLNERVLGKPGSHEEAARQLLDASGREVLFQTGLCVLDTRDGHVSIDVIPFKVRFRDLDPPTVERYLEREPAYDAAGSFHAEGLGITLFRAMEGEDPTALVGLPLICLSHRLRERGFILP